MYSLQRLEEPSSLTHKLRQINNHFTAEESSMLLPRHETRSQVPSLQNLVFSIETLLLNLIMIGLEESFVIDLVLEGGLMSVSKMC